MPIRRPYCWLALAAVLALGAAAGLFYYLRGSRYFTRFEDSFAQSGLAGWQTYGGSWTLNNEVLHNLSSARGDKALTGNPRWSDYLLECDVRLNALPADSLWGDAGLVFRVSDPSTGVDSYDGYYLGIGSDANVLLLGRANYSWNRLAATPLSTKAQPGSWFHLRLVAQGCYFEASAEDLRTHTTNRLSFFDKDCKPRSGLVGVRSYLMPASWRYFRLSPLP